MASHGRRRASYKTKLRKQAKAEAREANTRLRRLKKNRVGKESPAISHLTDNGAPFSTKGLHSVNDLRRLKSEAGQFNSAKTSTVRGAKKVLKRTLTNIATGGGRISEEQVKQFNIPEIVFDDDESGVHFVQEYFDIYYKAKEALNSDHIYVSSEDLLEAITEELDDAVGYDVEGPKQTENGDAEVDLVINTLTNDEFLQGVIDRLEG